jgi:hypothetical protein
MDEIKRGFELAGRARDRRLRRQLLALLYDARSNQSLWTSAVTLRDAIDAVVPEDQRFESDRHCIALCRDLSISGLADERNTRVPRGTKFGLAHLEFRVTAGGLNLLLENSPPNPLVDDDRIT